MIRVTASTFTIDAAAPDGTPTRTITGIAVPYNVVANASGTEVMFIRGSLPTEGKAPKLYMSHDASQAIGIVTERDDDEEHMYFVARVSSTELGDDALVLAADGVLDSVSVGVNPTKYIYDDDGVMVIEAAQWLELSLVSQPAFAESVITKVAASSDTSDANLCNNDDGDAGEATEPTEETTQVSQEPITPEVIEASAPKQYAQVKREPRLPNFFEYMAAMHIGGDTWVNAQKAFKDHLDFTSGPKINAAAGDEFLTSVPGLLTKVTLGPVFQDLNFIRPTVNALGARAMPGTPASTFNRPTITTHTAQATAQTEGAAVATQTMVIANNTVTKKTFANSLNISYQTIDFTDPSALQILITDLVGQYMMGTDNEAADALLTAATSAGVWDLSVADLYTSIYDAAMVTLAATNFLPTHMFVSTDTYGKIMKLADTTGRPLFANYGGPALQGVNAIGVGNVVENGNLVNNSGPLGLTLVVDKNFADKTMVIMRAEGFECYEDYRGILSIDAPATLTRTVSTHGYFATFAANSDMIQKITQA